MYPFLDTSALTLQDYRLAPLRKDDVQLIRTWRNAQRERLYQDRIITMGEQNLFYRNEVLPTFDHYRPPRIALSLLLRGACIACGGLDRVDWQHRRARLYRVFATERHGNPLSYQTEATVFVRLILRMAFTQAGLERICAEVPGRERLEQSVFREAGFTEEGRMRNYFRAETWADDCLLFACLSNDD